MTDDHHSRIFIPEQPEFHDSQPRKRFKESCDHCGAAKVKCSRDKPACARCNTRGLPCYYSPAQRSKRANTGLDSSIWWDINSFGTFPLSDNHGLDDVFDFDEALEIVNDQFNSNSQNHLDKSLSPSLRNSLAREANPIDTSVFSSMQDGDSHTALQSPEGAAVARPTVAQRSFSIQRNTEIENRPGEERVPVPRSLEGIDDLLRRTERLEDALTLPQSPVSPLGIMDSQDPALYTNSESGKKLDCSQLLLSIQRNLSTSTSYHTMCPNATSQVNELLTLSTNTTSNNNNNLTLHSTLINRLRHVFSCTCYRNPDVQLLLGVVFRQILSWYRSLMDSSTRHEKTQYHTQHVFEPARNTPRSFTSNSSPLHSSRDTLLGIICTGSEDVMSSQAKFVLILLQDIAQLIKNFAEICEIGSDDLGKALARSLRRYLKTITKEVVSIL